MRSTRPPARRRRCSTRQGGRARALPGARRRRAVTAARSPVAGSTMNPVRTAAVVTIGDDLYYYTFDARAARTRLTSTPGRRRSSTFSPDGELVGFVRGNNLYVVDVDHAARAPAHHRRRPADPQRHARLGLPGGNLRARQYRAYWWSPDSRHLAFLQLDDSRCRNSPSSITSRDASTVETWDYPKAGDPNPRVRLGVVASPAAPPPWVDLDQVRAGASTSSSTSSGRRTAAASSTKCRTASRPGSTSTSAIADGGDAKHAVARDDQGLGRPTTARPPG